MKTERRVKFGKVLIFVVLFVAFLSVGCASASTYTVCSNGCDYASIQVAIDAADSGDTIEVHSGTYYENVNVTKQLIVMGVDTGTGKPAVDTEGNGSAITLLANGIALEGFTTTNSLTGIQVNSNNNIIKNNNASNSKKGYDLWYGIYLSSSRNNIITGNNVCNNRHNFGIYLISSSNNHVTGNNISSNGDGIHLASSSNNHITGNNVSNNGDGIRLYYSRNNTITRNNVCNNGDGIRLYYSRNNTITRNNVANNGEGIRLYSSSNNTITCNTFVNDGLRVYESYHNAVESNIVNGKPLVYLEDVSDYEVGDAGQVILVNCDNITVANQNLSNTDVGIALWETENSRISNNKVNSNNWAGITLSFSSINNLLTGNNISGNNWAGISIQFSSNNNTITGNNVSNNGNGIILGTSNNIITGNNVSNNGNGICLGYSNNTIAGNNVSNNFDDGIYLDSSSNSTITGNTFVNDGFGVSESYQNTVEDNIVNSKPLVYLEDVSDYEVGDAGQVILVNCDNITVANLNLSNTDVGIMLWKTENSQISNNSVSNNGQSILLHSSSNNAITGNNVNNNGQSIHLQYSSNNIITDNNVSGNNWTGIRLYFSSNNNTITGNNVSGNNWDGINIQSSNNNTITGNNVSGNNFDAGISIQSSNNNTIIGNNVSNNGVGTYLYTSSSNTITGNTFVDDGLWVSESYQNTVEDNIVNGKPLVYLEDVSDYEVGDAGQVILVNCDNITVANLNLSDTDVGIMLWKTENTRISNNIVSDNSPDGIYLSYFSNNNTITDNIVSSNRYNGILLSYSSNNNLLTGNIVGNNFDDGISLSYSCNNTITSNNVNSNNEDGIRLYYSSSNNKIYLNNFINNTDNVYSEGSSNIWNATEKITYTYSGNTYTNYLGNYWSDYKEKYPDAKEIDGCGFWNTPYSIEGDKDNYPLMVPFENYFPEEKPPTITSFNPSSSVSDIEGATRTFSITINQTVNVSWLINGTEVQKNTSVTSASYTNKSAAVGTRNVSAIATNANGSDMQVWIWNVTSLPYTHTDVGVTVDIELTEPCEIEPLLPQGTDISKAIVINVNVTDDTPENATDEAYTDITIKVGELDVETCEVYKEGSGFLPEVDDVTKLPAVNGSAKFSRDVANNSVIVRLYVGDPLLGVIPSAIEGVFDTGAGTYPSIMGTHNGTIRLNKTIEVQKMYTYPCAGTGGHTEYVAFYNATTGDLIAKGAWEGYLAEDYHYIIFEDHFSIENDVTYNYTIQTGSYPQIIHEHTANVTGGIITCTEFIDANGKIYYDWIPAIRLE